MKIKEGFVKRKVADRYIVVAAGELANSFHAMIELNSTASDIWDMVDEGLGIEEIAAKLAEKYGISEEDAGNDVKETVSEMKKYGVFHE